MKHFSDWTCALDEIASLAPSLLLIEGGESVGKSPFARELALRTEALALSTDVFARRRTGAQSYFQLVDRGALLGALEQAARPLIVEGVCLRQLLPTSATDQAVVLYIKRLSELGIWHLGLNVEAFREREVGPWLEQEVLAYHHEHKPHELCDIMLSLSESAGP